MAHREHPKSSARQLLMRALYRAPFARRSPRASSAEPSHRHACPRCFGALVFDRPSDRPGRAVVLACPEAYCDYVLVLGERELASGTGGWGAAALAWIKRAAS